MRILRWHPNCRRDHFRARGGRFIDRCLPYLHRGRRCDGRLPKLVGASHGGDEFHELLQLLLQSGHFGRLLLHLLLDEVALPPLLEGRRLRRRLRDIIFDHAVAAVASIAPRILTRRPVGMALGVQAFHRVQCASSAYNGGRRAQSSGLARASSYGGGRADVIADASAEVAQVASGRLLCFFRPLVNVLELLHHAFIERSDALGR